MSVSGCHVQVPNHSGRVIHFGAFQIDLSSGELRKHGIKLRLQEQPFQILVMLLERPGQVVTREELRSRLWPADTFVDFDVGLNNAILRLRNVLGDSTEKPRFIETLPRRGYRFLAAVDVISVLLPPPAITQPSSSSVGQGPIASGQAVPIDGTRLPALRARSAKFWLAAGVPVVAVALLFGFNVGRFRERILGRPAAPRIQSIAVLPLENLTGDPGQEYFVDGMTDALITDLARIGSLRVISRTSSMQYKRAQKQLPQIAQELKVDAVVEGTVVRSGDRVRIDAQLILANTDQHLWADSYEGTLDQILALQSAVAEAISNQVRARLTPEERARLANQRAVSPEAYELYLRGRYFLEIRTQDGINKALQYFQEATEKDPTSALAFSGLADAYGLLGGFGFLPVKEAVSKARAAAEKAVSLDGSSTEALTSLAAQTDDPAEAEKLFRRALQGNPGYAQARHWYARFLSENKRYDEALTEIRRARSLDPLSVRIIVNEGEILFFAGQFDKAREQLQMALDMNPNFPITHWALGRSLFYAHQYEAALGHLRKAVELNPNAPNFHYWLGVVYEFSGRYREAIPQFERTDLLNGMSPAEASTRAAALRKALTGSGERAYWREWVALRMKDREKSPHAYAYNIAYDYAHLGDTASAVAWLETCLQEKSCTPSVVRGDPGLDGLRSDPPFQSLLTQMNSLQQQISPGKP